MDIFLTEIALWEHVGSRHPSLLKNWLVRNNPTVPSLDEPRLQSDNESKSRLSVTNETKRDIPSSSIIRKNTYQNLL